MIMTLLLVVAEESGAHLRRTKFQIDFIIIKRKIIKQRLKSKILKILRNTFFIVIKIDLKTRFLKF